MGDAYYYRGHVRHHLGKVADAKADFEQAIKLGTNFPTEAHAAIANAPFAPGGGLTPSELSSASSSIASQIVSKGVFAGKAPAGVSVGVWQGVLQRRGAEDLRQKLLAAYGGKCAVSGADAEAALEVALIDPDGPAEPKNALLLRADIRTLFDLNLLRVHPQTRKVVLAAAVLNGAYARLWARPVRPPESKDAAPSFTALEKRWNAAK